MLTRILVLFIFLITLNPLGANALSNAKQQETIKKSIIKALIENIDNNYLSLEKTGNKKWESEEFYKNITPISEINDILNETSHFIPVGNHEFVIDGDKVFKKTGIYVDDIPGKAIVVYDQKTIETPWLYQKHFIDGDARQYNNESLFNPKDKEEVIIFDCLIPSGFDCTAQTVALITEN